MLIKAMYVSIACARSKYVMDPGCSLSRTRDALWRDASTGSKAPETEGGSSLIQPLSRSEPRLEKTQIKRREMQLIQ